MPNEELSLSSLAQSWLDQQCQSVSSISKGLVVLGGVDHAVLIPAAAWPLGSEATPTLTAAAKLAIGRKRPVVQAGSGSSDGPQLPNSAVACPILVDGKLFGVVAVELASNGEQERQAVMQLLQWGCTWLEFLVHRETSAVTHRLMTVLELVAMVLDQERFQAAATEAATDLASRMGCERVSIGFLSGQRMQVRALSHSAQFGKKTNLVRDIAAAMDEARDQDAIIVYPDQISTTPKVTKAHANLARRHGSRAVCTIPFSDASRLAGVVVLERSDVEFDPPTVELCEAILSLIGPILESKRKDDRWIGAKFGEILFGFVKKIIGPRHVALKLSLLALIATGCFLTYATTEYRVTAPAALEGAIQRSVVAPMDGYIAEAEARAGDIVKIGQVLGRLDNKDLTLERLKWQSQREQFIKEHRSALAEHDRVQTRVLTAQIEQAQAQLALLDEQLARTEFSAPFDGLVVSGDLTQSLGAPVEQGELLFEVAPLDAYRVVLKVDERKISDVQVGALGKIALSAVPDKPLPFTVTKVTPVSSVESGSNQFRVEAQLDELPAFLRPGMEGIAKIDVEERHLLWIWSHPLIDWLRIQLWTWWP